MLSSQIPSVPSILKANFCISCLWSLIIPTSVIPRVPHQLAALHNRAAYVIPPGSSWYMRRREDSAMMVRFNIKASKSDPSLNSFV